LEDDNGVNTYSGTTQSQTSGGTTSNVTMIAPDGKLGSVPQSEVARLTKLGYKQQ